MQGNIKFTRINLIEGIHVHVELGCERRFGRAQFEVGQGNACRIEPNMTAKMIYTNTAFLLKGAYAEIHFQLRLTEIKRVDAQIQFCKMYVIRV